MISRRFDLLPIFTFLFAIAFDSSAVDFTPQYAAMKFKQSKEDYSYLDWEIIYSRLGDSSWRATAISQGDGAKLLWDRRARRRLSKGGLMELRCEGKTLRSIEPPYFMNCPTGLYFDKSPDRINYMGVHFESRFNGKTVEISEAELTHRPSYLSGLVSVTDDNDIRFSSQLGYVYTAKDTCRFSRGSLICKREYFVPDSLKNREDGVWLLSGYYRLERIDDELTER